MKLHERIRYVGLNPNHTAIQVPIQTDDTWRDGKEEPPLLMFHEEPRGLGPLPRNILDRAGNPLPFRTDGTAIWRDPAFCKPGCDPGGPSSVTRHTGQVPLLHALCAPRAPLLQKGARRAWARAVINRANFELRLATGSITL